MPKLILLAIIQSALLAGGQVLLKFGLNKMEPFGWNWQFWQSALINWQFAMSGICFGCGSILWMYIIKNYPLSTSYPMVSLSYVFGMFSAIIFFNESVDLIKWIGVFLIITGCCIIAK